MAEPPALLRRVETLARESFALAELAALMRDPIYRGEKVARGDGRLVVVIPGLFANDFYLYPLRRWLARIGFRPSTSGLWVNAGCPNRLTGQVAAWVVRNRRTESERVAIVGHSRGGILARALAARLGARASHLVLLGAPVAPALEVARSTPPADLTELSTMNSLMQASNAARRLLDPDCSFPQCNCEFIDNMRAELSPETVALSIYMRNDPIVTPQSCVIKGGRNVEVGGTHSGLVYNREVYRELSRSLP